MESMLTVRMVTNGRINPLHIRFNIPDQDTGSGKVPLEELQPLAQHIRFLRSFLNAYKGNSSEVGLLHDNIIEKAITSVYERCGITFETNARYIKDNYGNDDYPIFSDVYDTIQDWLKNLEKSDKVYPEEVERYKVCLAFLEPIAYGTDSNLFNGHTNIDLDSNLINFNISALQEKYGITCIGCSILQYLILHLDRHYI